LSPDSSVIAIYAKAPAQLAVQGRLPRASLVAMIASAAPSNRSSNGVNITAPHRLRAPASRLRTRLDAPQTQSGPGAAGRPHPAIGLLIPLWQIVRCVGSASALRDAKRAEQRDGVPHPCLNVCFVSLRPAVYSPPDHAPLIHSLHNAGQSWEVSLSKTEQWFFNSFQERGWAFHPVPRTSCAGLVGREESVQGLISPMYRRRDVSSQTYLCPWLC
jgi:hypothetical protein